MRRIQLATLALAAGLVACPDPTGPAADPRDVTYAPQLGIEVSRMTRTASGLYYLDVTPGSGTQARAGDAVRVTYSGWLPDGTLFDSSTDPATPLEFSLGAGIVIPGWDEGITGMRVRGVRKLVVPPALGYGDREVGPIPANSVLVFEIGLVGIRN